MLSCAAIYVSCALWFLMMIILASLVIIMIPCLMWMMILFSYGLICTSCIELEKWNFDFEVDCAIWAPSWLSTMRWVPTLRKKMNSCEPHMASALRRRWIIWKMLHVVHVIASNFKMRFWSKGARVLVPSLLIHATLVDLMLVFSKFLLPNLSDPG